MKTLLMVAVGVLIGAAAFGGIFATSEQTQSIDVRLFASKTADGRTELGLQQRSNGGEWGDRIRPDSRFLPADIEAGDVRFSEPVALDVISRDQAVADNYRDYLFASGEEVGDLFSGWVEEGEAPGTLICIVDTNDAGVATLCEGTASTYTGETETVAISDWDDLRAVLEYRFSDETVTAVFPTSLPTTQLALQAEEATERWFDFIYWIELMNQHAASNDTVVCQITHSGHRIEDSDEGDLFWGLLSEVSAAAAGQLGIQVQFSSHVDPNGQAAAIRECIKDGVNVIATSLAEPDVLAPALAEAAAADIPVVSFNSGAATATEVGSALHVALDDRAAGELAGEAFNDHEISAPILCVIHEPTNVGLHDRCDGLEASFDGEVERFVAEDPAAVHEELASRIMVGDLGAILTLSVDSTWDARVARYEAESEIPIAGFGFSLGMARAVAGGSMLFVIFDHPEVQSYLSLASAVIVDRWRLDPMAYFGGMSLLLTPQIVGQEEMQSLLDTLLAD